MIVTYKQIEVRSYDVRHSARHEQGNRTLLIIYLLKFGASTTWKTQQMIVLHETSQTNHTTGFVTVSEKTSLITQLFASTVSRKTNFKCLEYCALQWWQLRVHNFHTCYSNILFSRSFTEQVVNRQVSFHFRQLLNQVHWMSYTMSSGKVKGLINARKLNRKVKGQARLCYEPSGLKT